ncbi:MAG: hypothetical protein US16_C0063G0001 [Candidatus Moranbacteria bacterium GW2011_GWE2_36_40]|nr:MAG: hypothetical protein US16_C0063G0001 [Candidatus Moranbacteria bacterium GW2011_GWE2_36_40]
MSNPFEIFPERTNQEAKFFRKIFRKIELVPEESKRYRELGLEFNGDGSIASIKKESPAASKFNDIIVAKGDDEFELCGGLEDDEKFFVFEAKKQFSAADTYDDDFRQAA